MLKIEEVRHQSKLAVDHPSNMHGVGSRFPRQITLRSPALPKVGPLVIFCLSVPAIVCAFIGLEVSIPLAGAIYAILYVALACIRPDLTFLVIFLQAPLVWDLGLGPVNTAMADISLVLAAPILITYKLISGRSLGPNPLLWSISAYLLVCVFSTLVNGALADSFSSMFQMLLYLGLTVFVFGYCALQPEVLIRAFYGLLFTDAVIAIVLLTTRSNYVLGLHKNAVGSELDYAVVIAAELWLASSDRRRGHRLISAVFLLVSAGLFFSLSRGGWLGAIVGVLVLLVLHRRFVLAIKSVLILLPLVAGCWLLLPQESKDYAVDLSHSARNIEARYTSVAYAANLFDQSPVWGNGVGLRKTYDATNVVMSTLAETGVLGLITFLSIFFAMFRMVIRTCWRVNQESHFFSISAISGGLMAAKFAHGCVDHYWSRVMLPVWAAAGMGVYSYNSVRRPVRQKTPAAMEPPRR